MDCAWQESVGDDLFDTRHGAVDVQTLMKTRWEIAVILAYFIDSSFPSLSYTPPVCGVGDYLSLVEASEALNNMGLSTKLSYQCSDCPCQVNYPVSPKV